MQLVDELSMIYTTCLMAYASFSYSRTTTVRVCLGLSLTGLAVFITLYFLIWGMDNVFCSEIRRMRRTVGLPWGLFLEGHGWWYVFNLDLMIYYWTFH